MTAPWKATQQEGGNPFLRYFDAKMRYLREADVGLFVALGGFARDAHEAARNQERRRLTLIDIRRLYDLWIAHYRNLSDEARRRMPLRPVYFLSPEG